MIGLLLFTDCKKPCILHTGLSHKYWIKVIFYVFNILHSHGVKMITNDTKSNCEKLRDLVAMGINVLPRPMYIPSKQASKPACEHHHHATTLLFTA